MNKLLTVLISPSCLAAVNVPLTVQEAPYSAGTSGIARTNESLTIGVSLPDSAEITNPSVRGLTGAMAEQFKVGGRWPSGNIKWIKVRAIMPSTITQTDAGSGNFGAANLATDNGSTITVSTGTAIFTIKRTPMDQMWWMYGIPGIGGALQGFVILGPEAAYGNKSLEFLGRGTILRGMAQVDRLHRCLPEVPRHEHFHPYNNVFKLQPNDAAVFPYRLPSPSEEETISPGACRQLKYARLPLDAPRRSLQS